MLTVQALTLCMRLIHERAIHIPGAETQVWSSGLFKDLFEAVVESHNQAVQSEFVEKYDHVYDDVRYHTFSRIAYVSTLSVPE